MLGDNLRNERLKAGLNQVELAKIFNVSKQTVSNWESGNRIPDLKTTEQLADFYKVSIDYLLDKNINKDENKDDEELKEIKELYSVYKSLSETDRDIIDTLILKFKERNKKDK